MRFYFDLKLDAEEPSEDEEGLELEDAEAAQFEAAQLLFDLSRETIRFKKRLQVQATGKCDLPARRHAQGSRPDHQGRSMLAWYTPISPDKLTRLIGTAAAPALNDVCIDEDFSADPRLIQGAVRRSHLDVQGWASQMATFGGAYAVLAYVAQQAAGYYHWLSPREMLDGLGMAETMPGPLIMVVQLGFMAAFREASGLSPMLTFAPCFLWIFVGAPYVEALRGNKALAGALSAITAAVVGVILNLSIWFALHMLFRQTFPVHGLGLSFDAPVPSSIDLPALVLSIAAATAIFRFNVGILVVLAASCIAGILLRLAGVI